VDTESTRRERLTLLREQALSEIEAFLNVTQVATKLLNLACESGQFLVPHRSFPQPVPESLTKRAARQKEGSCRPQHQPGCRAKASVD